MAIQVRGSNYANGFASGDSIGKPAGTAAGDLLLLHVALSGSGANIIPPAGFALIRDDATITGIPDLRIYAKRAGASEPASYNIIHSGTAGASHVGIIGLYSDTGDYLALDDLAKQSNASSTTVEWPGVTTTVTNTLLLAFATLASSRDLNTPTGMARHYPPVSTASFIYLFTEAIAASGATGTRSTTFVSGAAATHRTMSLAIREQATPGDSRVTQAALYAEVSSDELRVTQAGLYAEIIQEQLRVTQAGVYFEISTPLTAVFRRPPLVPPLRQHLFLLQPAVVLAAQVAMDTIVYPVDTVLIGSITTGDPLLDVREGMTVVFGTVAGASDLGRTYIRKQPQTLGDEALIYIGLSSRGTRDGEIDISDGVYVTVLDDYRVWAKPQVFIPNGQGGVDIFKDSDIPIHYPGGSFTRTIQPPPVANSGPGVAAYAVGGSFAFPLSASGSFAVADGATIAGYGWDIGDGTLTSGTLTSASIVVDFPPGFRWVNVFITDSNGRTHRSYTPVLVVDPAADVTVPAWEVVTQRLTEERQELAVRVLSDIPAGTYPDGTLVMLWEGQADETVVYNDSYAHMRFCGWLDTQQQSIQGSRTGTLRNTVLQCLDIAGRLAQLPAYAHEIEHVDTNADTWLKMVDASIFKYIHYLLHWHSTALAVADWLRVPQGAGNVPADAANYDIIVLGSAASDLLDQVRTVARSLVPDYEWVTNLWGQMYLRVDPLLRDVSDRANQFAGLTLDASRYTSLEFEHLPTPRVRAVYGGAILSSHTPPIQTVFARAPGDTLGQGLSETRNEHQLALSQADLNAAEGHRYARLNAPESLFRLRMARAAELWNESFGPEHFQPAGTRWVRVTLPAEIAAQRGLSFTDARFLMREMVLTYNYRREGAERSIDLVLERETSGTPAVTYTLDVPMGWTPQIWLRGGVVVGNVVAAYEPFRAADLASSYVNQANPGTNNAAPGVAPTFDAGWVFDGSTQWLDTAIVPAAGYAMVVAFEDAAGTGVHAVAGSLTDGGSGFVLTPRDSGDGGVRRYSIGNATITLGTSEGGLPDGRLVAGVMGIDGTHAWRDTIRESDSAGTWTSAGVYNIVLGARNNAGTVDQFFAGKVTHAYIYSAPLTPYQMYAIMLGIQADLES